VFEQVLKVLYGYELVFERGWGVLAILDALRVLKI
jgi:hypothetical protein